MREATALALFALAASAAPAAERSPLWGNLEPGPHAVGFRVVERSDVSRPFRHPFDLDGKPRSIVVARPVQIGIWYPAEPSRRPTMRLGDYVDLMGSEQDFSVQGSNRTERGRRAYFAFTVVRDATEEKRRQLMELPTASVRDAKPAVGRFPVILWSLGSPALYQASAEYLASHGYVVAIAPRLPPIRSPVDTSQTRADYDAKSRDLSLVLDELTRFPAADVKVLGATGFSAGGRWAIGEAMRNPSIRAVVSLDSILFFPDEGGQFGQMPFFDPGTVRSPVLHMIRREWVPRESPQLWEAMRFADRIRLIFEPPLDHLDFASIGYASALVGLRGERRDTIERAFLAWNRVTRDFFDAHLKGDRPALERISRLPDSLDVPAKFVTLERKPADAAVPTEAQFLEAFEEDFPRATALYRRLLTERREAPISEAALNLIGYQFLALGRTADGVSALSLNLEAFPESANAHDSLADAFLAAGNRGRALELSRKALERLPKDKVSTPERRELIRQSAQQKIDDLTKPPAPP